MTNPQMEISRRHYQSKEKFVYFLLAGAGTSIAFSIAQTDSILINRTNFFLFGAFLFWSISFLSGCKVIKNLNKLTAANMGLLEMYKQFPNSQSEVRSHIDKETFNPLSAWIHFWEVAQILMLFVGAICLFAWKVASAYPDYFSQ